MLLKPPGAAQIPKMTDVPSNQYTLSAKPPSGSRRKDARGYALAAEEEAAAVVKRLQTIEDQLENLL